MNQHRPTALYVLRSILSGLYHFIGARDREHPWRLVGDLGSGSNVLISLQKEVFGRRGIWVVGGGGRRMGRIEMVEMKSEILNVGRAHVCARATFDRNRGTLIRFPAGLRAFVPRDPRILWMFINANNTGEFNGIA